LRSRCRAHLLTSAFCDRILAFSVLVVQLYAKRYLKFCALIGDEFVCRDVMSSQEVVDFVSQRLPSVSNPIFAIFVCTYLSSCRISCNRRASSVYSIAVHKLSCLRMHCVCSSVMFCKPNFCLCLLSLG